MQTDERALGVIGMAQRAGKAESGEFKALKALQAGRVFAVIVAEDASENTRKRFRDKCAFYGAAFELFSTKERLGRAIGKETRAVIALSDEGLSKAVLKLLKQIGGNGDEN